MFLLTSMSLFSIFNFLAKMFLKKVALKISELTERWKKDWKRVWKNGKQCVIFAPALRERPTGWGAKWSWHTERKRVAFWQIEWAEKNSKNKFGRIKNFTYLCTRFWKIQGLSKGATRQETKQIRKRVRGSGKTK